MRVLTIVRIDPQRRRPWPRLICWSGAILFVASALGCNSGQLPVAPTRGRITLEGQSVRKGLVVFTPERGRSATGVIEPNGQFVLTTFRKGDGAIVGMHRVAISSADQQPGADPADMDSPSTWLVPAKYHDPTTSGLKFEVRANLANEADFDLSDTSSNE